MKRQLCHWQAVLAALLLSGCAGRDALWERYVPEPELARRALTEALGAWQRGESAGRVTGAGPSIQVVDTHRVTAQRLERYEVLGEILGDGPRSFSVRLTLENPPDVRCVRYLVVGIDPLWVFREDDYAMIAHWECPMPEPAPGLASSAQEP